MIRQSSKLYVIMNVMLYFIGVIIVHDLTNRKSQQNLRKWLAEVLNKDNKDGREE